MKSPVLLLLLLFVEESLAQAVLVEKPDSIRSAKESSFAHVSAGFTSDYYYMGRSDSATAPYVTFSSGYYHKSGFFARGSVSYLAVKGDGRIDVYTIAGGYQYFGKKLFAGAFLSKYFFDARSYAVQSEMNAYLNGFAGYDFYYVTLIADVAGGFSESTDFFAGAEVRHTFYALGDRLRITPSVYVAAGSQYYYDQYYSNRSVSTGKGKGKGKGAGPGPDQTSYSPIYIKESDKFEILNYEASVEVSYKVKHLRFTLLPVWTFPVNPSTVVTDATGVGYREELNNGFYWSAIVRYIID